MVSNGIALDAFHQRIRAVVSRQAQVPHHLLLLHFEQRFHRAALGENLVHVVLRADVVQLPKVHVVGLQQLQRLLNHAHRVVARALLGLGREKCLVAPLGHHLATYCSLQRSGPP